MTDSQVASRGLMLHGVKTKNHDEGDNDDDRVVTKWRHKNGQVQKQCWEGL